MASSSSSSSVSSSMSRNRKRNYDVFLSLRGVDTRGTFVSHLYDALVRSGVSAFKDDPELESGVRRSELFRAIDGSRISVVVFSENYPQSRWCLEELTKIMERKDREEIDVLPVFYRVTPQEVRKNKEGRYGIAMEEMAAKHGGEDSETLKRWRKALYEGGDLIGPCLSQGDDEAKVVQKIVKDILKILNRVPLEVAKHPIGITSRLEEIEPLLKIPSDDSSRMIGIHGTGGAGKTTLSKAILNEYSSHFHSWCFLPNVREISEASTRGLADLQQTLLRELLGLDDLTVSNVDRGKVLIMERLRNKKVIVVLDDVNELKQLAALAGNVDCWFGEGSRIIVTTRDSHLLTTGGVRDVYKARLLDEADARDLFRSHAFHDSSNNTEIENHLVDRFLDYAKGLPLALVVLGASLKGRSADEWKSTLEKVKRNPNKTINSILKISFDGLEDHEKEIFLDIACFFKGWSRDRVVRILDGCGFATMIDIQILVERSLLYIDKKRFEMHDLLEEMGKSIAREEKDAGKSIRVWLYEDLQSIMSDDEDAERRLVKVKGIVLDLSGIWKEQGLIDVSNFKRFKQLRLLIVRIKVHLNGPLHLPSELRWFEWWGYSASTIDFSSSKKLVGIEMPSSGVREIKGGKVNVDISRFRLFLEAHSRILACLQDLEDLKYLDLSENDLLDALPDLSKSSKLEHLILEECIILRVLDESIGSLDKLTHLNTRACINLTKVPSKFKSRNFHRLDFSDCWKLGEFPVMEEKLEFLSELRMDGCPRLSSLPSLHTFIGLYPGRVIIDLSNCHSLDPSYIDSSLPYEQKIQEFVGGRLDVIVPGTMFPRWMNFQNGDCYSGYRVTPPVDVNEDDILGMAVCVSFQRSYRPEVYFMIGSNLFLMPRRLELFLETEHTWLIYLPRQSLPPDDRGITLDMDWSNVTFQLYCEGSILLRCGMSMVCKQERTGHGLTVHHAEGIVNAYEPYLLQVIYIPGNKYLRCF